MLDTYNDNGPFRQLSGTLVLLLWVIVIHKKIIVIAPEQLFVQMMAS